MSDDGCHDEGLCGRPLIEVLLPTTAPVAIASALHARGVTVAWRQAALLDEHPTAWSRYLNGRSPRASRVQAWLERLDAGGHTLHLTRDPHVGCVVREAT